MAMKKASGKVVQEAVSIDEEKRAERAARKRERYLDMMKGTSFSVEFSMQDGQYLIKVDGKNVVEPTTNSGDQLRNFHDLVRCLERSAVAQARLTQLKG